MAYRQLTATTTKAELLPANAKRTAVTIKNFSGSTVFIDQDQSDVTGKGFPLAVGDFLTLTLALGDEPYDALYCQTLALTADLRIEESFSPRVDPRLRVA